MRLLLAFLLSAFGFPFSLAAAITITGAEIESSGESIRIFMNDGSTNGAFNFGFATNNIVSASTPSFTYTVPGFNQSGGSITFSEQFYVTDVMMTNYPFQTNIWSVAVSGGSYIRCSISKRVTISDTGGLLNVPANWYSNNTAVTGLTITNSSQLTYGSLRPVVMWRSMPWQLEGSNVLMKVVARSYFAETNPMHYVELWANSGAVNTPTQAVTQARVFWDANDPVRVQEYGVIHNYGVFPQGATVTNHFTAKERRGTNVFSTITSPFPPDHPDYAPLISFCNKSNTWPYVVALVDATNGSTAGVAVTNWATATNGSTPAFATIAQAKHAAGLTNNAVNGTNTYSNCFIMFANTNAQQYGWMGGETPGTRGASTSWTCYMPLPWVNKTNVRISFVTSGAVGQKNIKNHIKGVNLDWTANATLFANGDGHWWIDDCLINTNTGGSATGLTGFTTNTWLTYCTILRLRGNPVNNLGGAQYSNLRVWGNIVHGLPENTTCIWTPALFVGNKVVSVGTQQQFVLKNDTFANPGLGLVDPAFWSFNEIWNQDNNSGAGITTIAIGLATNLTIGAVVDNNLLEGRNYGTAPQFDIMQSQRLGETCTNWMSSGMTCLMVYHPVFDLATNTTLVGWHDKNGVFLSISFRGDVSGLNANFTNRLGRYYSVDCVGNAATLIGVEQFPDMFAWNITATGNRGFNGLNFLGITNLPALQNNILGFVDNRSAYGGTTNGFGNYLLRLNSPIHGTNALVAIRPENVYPADIRGVPRGRWTGKTPDTPGAYSQNKLRAGL